MKITDIRNPWRDALLPASFKNVEFHVEAMSEDNGRRIVTHEFPKKEYPYSEDMGRRAFSYTVRGYCISFMSDTNIPLYQRDYRVPRDLLRYALDQGGYGWLQLPTFRPVRVVCERYRLTEETRFGGYCTFDMAFTELGVAPSAPRQSTRELLITQSNAMTQQIITNLTRTGMSDAQSRSR